MDIGVNWRIMSNSLVVFEVWFLVLWFRFRFRYARPATCAWLRLWCDMFLICYMRAERSRIKECRSLVLRYSLWVCSGAAGRQRSEKYCQRTDNVSSAQHKE